MKRILFMLMVALITMVTSVTSMIAAPVALAAQEGPAEQNAERLAYDAKVKQIDTAVQAIDDKFAVAVAKVSDKLRTAEADGRLSQYSELSSKLERLLGEWNAAKDEYFQSIGYEKKVQEPEAGLMSTGPGNMTYSHSIYFPPGGGAGDPILFTVIYSWLTDGDFLAGPRDYASIQITSPTWKVSQTSCSTYNAQGSTGSSTVVLPNAPSNSGIVAYAGEEYFGPFGGKAENFCFNEDTNACMAQQVILKAYVKAESGSCQGHASYLHAYNSGTLNISMDAYGNLTAGVGTTASTWTLSHPFVNLG